VHLGRLHVHRAEQVSPVLEDPRTHVVIGPADVPNVLPPTRCEGIDRGIGPFDVAPKVSVEVMALMCTGMSMHQQILEVMDSPVSQ
jgi:hypothetical protein